DIDVGHLPQEIAGDAAVLAPADDSVGLQPLPEAMHLFEREYLLRGLALAGGKRTQAATLLGISRKNLWQKLRRHGLLDFDPEPEAAKGASAGGPTEAL
ncbi:MAG: hypothetical protein EOO40_11655, partial [Deltaproteobacteria bacterium]